MASLWCTHCKRSQIGQLLKQDNMMRNILHNFVDRAYVFKDTLIDRLISEDVLQTKHCELLTVPRERAQFARKIWDLLLRQPPRKFKKHVEPLLEELGFLEDQDVTMPLRTSMCLRCAMEHFLPLEELADTLVSLGFLKGAEYRDMVNSCMCELYRWQVMFACLQREHQDQRAVNIVEQLLRDFEIPVPQGMKYILQGGVTCACNMMQPMEEHSDLLAEPPVESLCHCWERQTGFTRRAHRHVAFRAAAETDLCPPIDVVDGAELVEMRDRSCRNLRKKRMDMAERFQRDQMKPNSAKRVSG